MVAVDALARPARLHGRHTMTTPFSSSRLKQSPPYYPSPADLMLVAGVAGVAIGAVMHLAGWL